MQLVLLGLNHKTAPVEVREAFSFTPEEQNNALEFLYNYPGIIECVVLSTCNRMEIYALVKQCQDPHDLIFKALCQIRSIATGYEEAFYCKTDRACVDHLFHVSSGLDSLVVGEGQILSQLKAAYLRSYQGGYTETVFNILFQRAIRIGKLVRTRTAIADTPVSVSYTAVNLAEEVLNKPMNQAKALILGAGTMSELTATHLQAKGINTIFVSNKTYSKAQALAERFGGQAIRLDDYVELAKQADILITSTGAPHYLVDLEAAKEIAAAKKGQPFVMIDIAVPRDIDPVVETIDGIHLFNIDALESVVENNRKQRLEEAHKAEPLIEEAVNELFEKLDYLRVRPMMALLADKAEQIRQRELHRAMAKLSDLPDHERRIMESMSRMIVRKLLRDPMIHLQHVETVISKEEEDQYWAIFRDMFNLQKEK